VRVLVISAAYPPMHAGESANAHHLCTHLAQEGLDVQVLTSIGNTGAGVAGVTVHPVMRRWSWREVPRLSRFVGRCAPDAVLLMYLGGMYKYHPMMTFAPTIVKRRLPAIPFVTRYESPFAGAAPTSARLTTRVVRRLAAQAAGANDVGYDSGTLLRDSDHVIVLCEGHRTVLTREWAAAAGKIAVIPPPPNVRVSGETPEAARERGRAKLGVDADDFLVAFFGYVYPKKGIETLLAAFEILRRERPRARLVFIGGTLDLDAEVSRRYWDDMQRRCAALGVTDRTIWTGSFNSDGDDASLYLRAADVCVLPLLAGVQLNNSSFSAMAAHGLPIVTTRGPMTDQAFVDGDNVLLCEPANAPALAKGLRTLMDSEDLRERLRAGVTKLAHDWLSWDEAIARTTALLKVRGH
jgi:glycosyltransferase involved in cell wall biosynthesis